MKTYKVTVDSVNTIRWYNDANEFHREGAPAIEFADGYKLWYFNHKLHRKDGPAVEFSNGGKEWYIDNQLHREDGPAVEQADGYNRWFIRGRELAEEDFIKETSAPDCSGKTITIDGRDYAKDSAGNYILVPN